ncbi:DUF2971 domain-containing protein [Vibrio paracholerae]|uniref:DUF2971 domain-containing protein n=1 Tax=Vibrio paracholerae TaxID=650003 RepID=UPI00216AC6FD
MWSHYADQYRGFVIGFNSDHEWFKKPDAFGGPTEIIKVKYLEKRVLSLLIQHLLTRFWVRNLSIGNMKKNID